MNIGESEKCPSCFFSQFLENGLRKFARLEKASVQQHQLAIQNHVCRVCCPALDLQPVKVHPAWEQFSVPIFAIPPRLVHARHLDGGNQHPNFSTKHVENAQVHLAGLWQHVANL